MLKKPPELDTNPIYQRLTRNSGWPDEKAERWLIVGIVGAGLLIDLAASLMPNSRLFRPLIWLGGISVILTPVIAALVAVSIVTHDLQKEDFQMMKLTLATDKSLLHGYTFATLHRLRALFISTRSLIPSLIALWVIDLFSSPLLSASRYATIIMAAIVTLIGMFPLIIATRQTCEIGAALGVTLALWWQQPIPAAIGASVIMLIVSPTILGACVLFLGYVTTCGFLYGLI